eukprot:4789317-Prymnesium_polylepis.2
MKKVLDDEGKWRGQWFGGDKDEWRGEWVEDESGEYLCTEPKYAASAIKQFLEEGLQRVHLYSAAAILPKSDDDDVCVFNPNSDNAFLFSGDPLSANVAWVRAGWDSNRGLSRARLEGPTRRVPVRWQLDTSPGAKSGSRTPRRRAAGRDDAEASMARDKGVPILRVRCGDEFLQCRDDMKPVLKALAEAMKRGKPPSKPETVDRYYFLPHFIDEYDLVEVTVDYERDEEGKLKKDDDGYLVGKPLVEVKADEEARRLVDVN